MKSEALAGAFRDTCNSVCAKCSLAGRLWSREVCLGASEVHETPWDFPEATKDAVSPRKLPLAYVDDRNLFTGGFVTQVTHVTFTTVT